MTRKTVFGPPCVSPGPTTVEFVSAWAAAKAAWKYLEIDIAVPDYFQRTEAISSL